MFTIEVKKKDKDEKFSLKDLELFHGDCNGGKITQKWSQFWVLHCERCTRDYRVDVEHEDGRRVIPMVSATAVDGKERKCNKVEINLDLGKFIVRQKT